jgi:hypothetical protein
MNDVFENIEKHIAEGRDHVRPENQTWFPVKMDNYFPTVVEEMDTYVDYDSICADILEEFTIRKDIQPTACSTRPPEKIQKKGRKTPRVVQKWRDLIKPYKPSEDGKYIKKSGVQTESVSEMCNDDMNSESWEYRRYVSFSIKIRWLVVVVSL